MKITNNFTLSEFTYSSTAASMHIDNEPGTIPIANMKLLCEKILQPLRDAYGKPIIITSGYRSPALNNAISGAQNSQHMFGQAADLIPSISLTRGDSMKEETRKLFELIISLKLPFDQLIDEKNYSWIHVSYGPRHRRQVLHI